MLDLEDTWVPGRCLKGVLSPAATFCDTPLRVPEVAPEAGVPARSQESWALVLLWLAL